MSTNTATLTPQQDAQYQQMETAMERSQLFQQKMTMLQMENSVEMARLQAMKGAFDKIRG